MSGGRALVVLFDLLVMFVVLTNGCRSWGRGPPAHHPQPKAAASAGWRYDDGMKRRVLTLLVFLVLGGIVTVAVAWGFALRMPTPLEEGKRYLSQQNDLILIIERRHGDVRLTAYDARSTAFPGLMLEVDRETFEAMLPRESGFHDAHWIKEQLVLTRSFGSTDALIEHGHGWPMLALMGSMTFIFGPNGSTGYGNGLYEIGPLSLGPFSTGPWYRRVLPLRPMWPGFAVNTVLYGFVLWLMVTLAFMLRNRRRIRRGLCWKCAYNLRGMPVTGIACPECGAAVRVLKQA